jgi:arabinogalactan oligomer/maltooligosaccharide transport system permease protein
VTAILSLLAQSAVASGEIAIGVFLIVAIVALNFTYFTKISIPLKFFVPGILFFIAFVIAPILFTVLMSTYNYQTGNYISKDAAIEQVLMQIKLLLILFQEKLQTAVKPFWSQILLIKNSLFQLAMN